MEHGVIKPVTEVDLEQAATLEKEGYPHDEAASPESIAFRQAKAPNLFVGYFLENRLVGYICGTRSDGQHMEAESLHEHREQGENVCIHSVCVSSSHRRQGVASALLRYYIDRVIPKEEGVRRVLLICKSHMTPLYTKVGFSLVGKSDIAFGADPWYEMALTPGS